MAHLDLDRLRNTWRRLLDIDVARALARPDDYPPEVHTVIRQEAHRRQLDPATVDLSEDDRPAQVIRFFRATTRFFRLLALVIHHFVRVHRLVSAAGLGIVIAVISRLLPQAMTWPVWIAYTACLVVCYLAGLSYVSWPLRRYASVIAITFAAWGGHFAVGVVTMLLWTVSDYPLRAWLFAWAGHFVTAGVIPCGLLCLAVFIHRRYWPEYPEGHCEVCGYNLHALPEPRCPECGTPFDPASQTPT